MPGKAKRALLALTAGVDYESGVAAIYALLMSQLQAHSGIIPTSGFPQKHACAGSKLDTKSWLRSGRSMYLNVISNTRPGEVILKGAIVRLHGTGGGLIIGSRAMYTVLVARAGRMYRLSCGELGVDVLEPAVEVIVDDIAYIIWETVESRANPASSVEMKQEPFKIPDMAFCMSWLEGCLNFGYNSCFYPGVAYWSSAGNFGFLNDLGNFTEDERSLAIEEEYPACRVIPFSRLEVNQTGVDNGDINYFSASLYFLWDEDPYHNYEITDFKINTQFVKVFFIDIDKDVKTIGEEILDAKLPYDRINITTDEGFVITKNHMVLTMTEFVGISTSNGAKQKPERTYFQQITSGKQNWWWTGIDGNGTLFSFLSLEITIDKFEYTRIVEIDPVDGWAIIGSIGGVWQFVVLGFGLFFVYAEKQRPDMKMRNMKKTMLKPASVVTQRLSIASSKSSDQDVVVDASDEDLPVEWVKRLRNNGSFYYYNSMTGAMQRSRPDERIETNNATGAPAVPQRSSLLTRAFQTPHKNPLGASDGANQRTAKSHENNDQGNERLPPGWIVRRNDQGRTYYMNTILKTTQWQRPTQYVASNHGTGVRAVDTPAARSRESLTSSFSDVHESKQQEQARDLDDPVGAFPSAGTAPSAVSRLSVSAEDTSLPPNWEKRVNQDGKIYYANSVTRKTQWEPPHL